MFEIPDPFPLIRALVTEFRLEIPETLRAVRVPIDVMLSCAGLVTTPATLAAATFPIKFEEFKLAMAEPLEATSKPLTVRPVRVPTLVMLVWAGLVTTPATLAFATFPTKFEALMLERPEPLPENRDPTTVLKLETPVMFRDWPKIEFRFEIPKTFRVAEPKTVAEFTYKVETLRTSVMLADPRTYKFEPSGGALKVPIDTPFW
jgi:hypothetical protein